MPAKRTEPYPTKVCVICQGVWQPANRYQHTRNLTCSPGCSAERISASKKGRLLVPRAIPCATCGTLVHRPASRLKKQTQVFCSGSCRSVTFAERCRAIAHKGAAARTPESFAKAAMKGSKNPAWKGGVTYRNRKGNYVSVRYVRCPPELLSMARTDGYVMEHRLVMARWIGRPLLRVECVHHEDHDPLNNPRSNLTLWPDNRSHKMAEHGRVAEGAANRLSLTVSALP